MLKNDLRSAYKIRRKSVSEDYLSNASSSIADAAIELPIWHHSYYHLFLPISRLKEIDTGYIRSHLIERGKRVVVPKMTSSRHLNHYLLIDTTQIIINKWGIPEPVAGTAVAPRQIDVVFLPLLAFDGKGNRVGYGKGFYDNFLKDCREDVVKIGLSLFEAEDLIEDTHENDIPMDYCITPKKTYSFVG